MNGFAFDTLSYSKQLEDAGFTRQQAEVQATAILAILEDKIASKRDLHETELRLQNELKETELRLQKDLRETELRLQNEIEKTRNEIEKTKNSLLKWQFGVAITLATIMAKGFGWLGF